MAGSQGTSTLDGIQKLGQQISALKFSPDSSQHMPFLTALEQALIKYVQSQHQQTAQAAAQAGQQAAMGAAQGGGAPGGAPGGMAAMMGGGGGAPGGPGGADPYGGAPGGLSIAPGGGAGMSGFGQPIDSDGLRRLLQSGSPG